MKKFLAIILIIIGIALAFGSLIQTQIERTIIGQANSAALWVVAILGIIAIIGGIILLRRK